MSESYKLIVNDNYTYAYDAESIQDLDIKKISENKYHILEKGKAFTIECIESDFSKKKYKISVNGNTYKVLIQDDLDLLIKKLGLTVNGKQKDHNIKAPMPGLILDISVKKGQRVNEGDALLVLEAMKMENVLVAPKDGIIKSIEIKKGDAVDKKQLLIEME